MKLEGIGFYTLCDKRAQNTGIDQTLARCELIITDACNFKCPYCRGPKHKRDPMMSFERAERIVRLWAAEGLQNIRFSGGEPTLHPKLPELVTLAKQRPGARQASWVSIELPFLPTALVV